LRDCTDYVAAVAAHDTDAVVRLFTPDATRRSPSVRLLKSGTPRYGVLKSSEAFPFTVRR